jgi:response regulator RpfG family c-di-GMP phosphodiesterase
MEQKKTFILLVDDNLNEHVFFIHTLKQIEHDTKLQTINGSIDLLKYLGNKQNPIPDILFLDVNMPLKNGKECLRDLRADRRYDAMPIVTYSTSDAQRDIDDAYIMGANLYLRKPDEMSDLTNLLSIVIDMYHKGHLKNIDRDKFLLSSASR